VRLRRLSEFSRGDFLAAAGGEMRSNYFKNGAPKSNFPIFARLIRPREARKGMEILVAIEKNILKCFYNYWVDLLRWRNRQTR